MSDYSCGVCREPWSFYHIHHDAPKWVKKLFIKGLGCECCEGVSPVHTQDFLEETALNNAKSILFNGEGEHETEAFETLERETQVFDGSQWVMPEPLKKWQCASCSIEHYIDCEGEKETRGGWWEPFYAERRRQDARDTESPRFIPGSKKIDKETGKLEVFCEGCWDTCDSGKEDCDAPTIRGPYNDGLEYGELGYHNTRPDDHYGHYSYCCDCYEECSSCCDVFHDWNKDSGDECEVASWHNKNCDERKEHLEHCDDKPKHMVPSFHYGSVIEVETDEGTFFCLAEYFFDVWDIPGQREIIEKHDPRYMLVGRMSAPGYMDCNEWSPIEDEDDIDDWIDNNVSSSCEVYLESLKKDIKALLEKEQV